MKPLMIALSLLLVLVCWPILLLALIVTLVTRTSQDKGLAKPPAVGSKQEPSKTTISPLYGTPAFYYLDPEVQADTLAEIEELRHMKP